MSFLDTIQEYEDKDLSFIFCEFKKLQEGIPHEIQLISCHPLSSSARGYQIFPLKEKIIVPLDIPSVPYYSSESYKARLKLLCEKSKEPKELFMSPYLAFCGKLFGADRDRNKIFLINTATCIRDFLAALNSSYMSGIDPELRVLQVTRKDRKFDIQWKMSRGKEDILPEKAEAPTCNLDALYWGKSPFEDLSLRRDEDLLVKIDQVLKEAETA